MGQNMKRRDFIGKSAFGLVSAGLLSPFMKNVLQLFSVALPQTNAYSSSKIFTNSHLGKSLFRFIKKQDYSVKHYRVVTCNSDTINALNFM